MEGRIGRSFAEYKSRRTLRKKILSELKVIFDEQKPALRKISISKRDALAFADKSKMISSVIDGQSNKSKVRATIGVKNGWASLRGHYSHENLGIEVKVGRGSNGTSKFTLSRRCRSIEYNHHDGSHFRQKTTVGDLEFFNGLMNKK